MQVAKWGNSLAIRLPRSVVEVLGLKEGDSIEIHVADRRSFAIEKAPTSKQLLERLRKYRGRLPAGSDSIAWKPMSEADSFLETNVLLYLLSKDAARRTWPRHCSQPAGLSACRCSMNLHRSLPANWQ